MMRKISVIIVLICLIILISMPVKAAEREIKATFHDAFYGGLTGALVGAALLIFTDKPEDHLNYIAYGFGVGIIGGAAYGVIRSTRAMAEIDNGKVVLHIPTPKTKITFVDNKKNLHVSMDILKYNF